MADIREIGGVSDIDIDRVCITERTKSSRNKMIHQEKLGRKQLGDYQEFNRNIDLFLLHYELNIIFLKCFVL